MAKYRGIAFLQHHNLLYVNGFRLASVMPLPFLELLGGAVMARQRTKAKPRVPSANAAILPLSTRRLAESIARSPEKSREFLIEAGIMTKGGKLSSKYK